VIRLQLLWRLVTLIKLAKPQACSQISGEANVPFAMGTATSRNCRQVGGLRSRSDRKKTPLSDVITMHSSPWQFSLGTLLGIIWACAVFCGFAATDFVALLYVGLPLMWAGLRCGTWWYRLRSDRAS